MLLTSFSYLTLYWNCQLLTAAAAAVKIINAVKAVDIVKTE